MIAQGSAHTTTLGCWALSGSTESRIRELVQVTIAACEIAGNAVNNVAECRQVQLGSADGEGVALSVNRVAV